MTNNTTTVDIETARERAHSERTQLVIAEHGNGLPWHPDHYEAEIRSELRRGAESFLRAGGLLLVARECASHGEWSGMIGRLGLEPRHAQRMMEFARRVERLPNASMSTHLMAAARSQGKLIELLSLPDDQFAELAETGETGGLTRDDVESMTVRELRNAVREAREKVAKRDETIAETSKHISELRDSVSNARRAWVQMTPDAQREKLKIEITKAVTAVEHPISEHNENGGLHGALCALHAHLVEHGGNEAHWVISQLSELQRQIEMLKLRWSAAV